MRLLILVEIWNFIDFLFLNIFSGEFDNKNNIKKVKTCKI